MQITATIRNTFEQNQVTVSTENNQKNIDIPGKADGFGSSVNGGELLFLALATCFCNDIYREASRRKMKLASVEVTVSGMFGAEGEPASGITYKTHIESPHQSKEELNDLITHVDGVAEVHNTLRKGVSVSLLRA